ncbi:hypothetical protein V8G69_07105 [Gaetbulibacter sp. M235]|uniref:hypothetical protein n=1 Tax=Gaetbulibacter sp. M235 TaxID=3126510 RepID=UPI00374F3050
MKFKQVEVSAFRIYNKPEDATFDFTTNGDDVANFVSLYAPNGFGKTSFYDAIEWGITNNVQRFWTNKNTLESIDALRASINGQVKLLRNTNSNRNTETFVKITTDKVELEPRYLRVHGSRKTDINWSSEIESSSFRQVILSQEWISAFLKEVNGERRYQLFMQNPDLVEIDNYFKGVKALCGENEKKIQSIKKEIDDIKHLIQPESDFNPLETINGEINSINKELLDKEPLQLITLNLTREQLKEFKDFVSEKIIDYSRESSIQERLSQIKTAKIGSDSIIGADRFYALNKDLKGINEKLNEISANLNKFREIEKKRTEIENLKKNLIESNKQELEHTDILNDYDYYNSRKEAHEKKINTLNSLEKEQLENNRQVEKLTREESVISNLNESLIKQKLEIEKLVNELPKIKDRKLYLKEELEKQNKFIDENKLEIIKKDSKINSLNDEIKELEQVKKETKNNDYSLMQLNENLELIRLVESLEKLNERKHELNKEVRDLDETIKHQRSFNSTLEEFIKSGLTIANNLQKSTCPLCEYQYNSYRELADSISKNKALNLTLQELLSRKNKLNENIENNTKEINKGINKLIIFYNEKIDVLVKERKNIEEQKELLNKSGKELTTTLEKLKEEEREVSVKLNGLTVDEFKLQLDTLKLKNTKDLDEVNKNLSEVKKNLIVVNEKHKNINSQIELIGKESKYLEDDKKYLKISNWLVQNLTSNDKSKIGLENKIQQISSKIKEIKDEISKSENLIQKYQKELSQLTQEKLVKSETDFQNSKRSIELKIEEYAYFLKDKFDVDIFNFDNKSLNQFLNEKETNLKFELQKCTALKESFSKLEKYAENIYPFLQSEIAKEGLIKKEKELSFIEKKVTPFLINEKRKTKEEIDERIRDFFYENLTNEIYRKIDPHPDFKEVQFKADFESNSPRLDVFVTDLSNKTNLIPNLYFSTAQVNILSLSIFLASALNSKEYDCIFIDDPIQSMDSINVLSTIDLLRGIIVNQNKQIILSTHDENFFNLLKKKIPNNIYKSKFLELESFGKLRKGNSKN